MILSILALSLSMQSPDPASSATPQPRPVAERRICRKVEVSGTRMARERICKTAAEWEAEGRSAQKVLTDRQDLSN